MATAKGVALRRAAATSIGAASEAAISWDSEDQDDDGYWAVGSPTRVTISADGWYLITATTDWTSSTVYGGLYPRWDGVTYMVPDGGGTEDHRECGAWIYRATAGQYVEIMVYNNRPFARTLDNARVAVVALGSI